MKKQINSATLCLLITSTFFSGITVAHADGSSWGSKALSLFSSASKTDSDATDAATSSFGNTAELAAALREALAVSAGRAIEALGQEGGFSNSELFEIPLPKSVESLRKPLALVNQDYRLDEFQDTMNLAAEEAVAASPEIVSNAIQNMSLEELTALWNGEDDAITRFLEKGSRTQLSEKMMPLIAKATDSSGATRSYKEIEDALPEAGGGLFSKLQSLTGMGDEDSFDLDTYINDQALDGLFEAMAIEEKAIREDPLARSTDLLKKLFQD
jgi:hypothetical protein